MVPHGPGKPRQISIHLSVIVLFLLAWTTITFWASYLSAQHVDYWRAKLSNQVLQLKLGYLVNELNRTRGFLDEVKQIEANLRRMINLNTEMTNATKEGVKKDKDGTGGPTLKEQNDVSHLLSNKYVEATWPQLFNEIQLLKSETQTRISSYEEVINWLNYENKLFMATPHGWPCWGRITSGYGSRKDPLIGIPVFHAGLDIGGPIGTPIRATADGLVKISNWHSGYGKLVVINHDCGFSTRYAHNSKLMVRAGEKVTRGQIIALLGETGHASGPHCHYEIWKNGVRKNPLPYISGTPGNIPAIAKVQQQAFRLGKKSLDKSLKQDKLKTEENQNLQ